MITRREANMYVSDATALVQRVYEDQLSMVRHWHSDVNAESTPAWVELKTTIHLEWIRRARACERLLFVAAELASREWALTGEEWMPYEEQLSKAGYVLRTRPTWSFKVDEDFERLHRMLCAKIEFIKAKPTRDRLHGFLGCRG
jgi:hypothetical protein